MLKYPKVKEGINIPNNSGSTPLFYAITSSYHVATLLRYGADPTVINKSGKNLLHSYIMRPELKGETRIEIIKLLLTHDSMTVDTINQKDNKGYTPLYLATMNTKYLDINTQINIVQLLLTKGADPNIQTNLGNSPLHISKNLKITQLLVDHKTNLDHVNLNGNTALHFSNNVKILTYLLQKGADFTIRNNKNELPKDIKMTSNLKALFSC